MNHNNVWLQWLNHFFFVLIIYSVLDNITLKILCYQKYCAIKVEKCMLDLFEQLLHTVVNERIGFKLLYWDSNLWKYNLLQIHAQTSHITLYLLVVSIVSLMSITDINLSQWRKLNSYYNILGINILLGIKP